MVSTIPNDLFINIVNYLNVCELPIIFSINNNYKSIKNNIIIKNKIDTYINDVNNYKLLHENMGEEFMEILMIKKKLKKYEDYKLLFTAKKINIGLQVGGTGYIDFITPSYFNNTNIIYGYDRYDRFFISIMYDRINNNKKTTNNVITFFQRYSDNGYYYVNGGQSFYGYSQVSNFNFNGNINNMDIQFNVFFDLITCGNSIRLFEEYDNDNGCYKMQKNEYNLSKYL